MSNHDQGRTQFLSYLAQMPDNSSLVTTARAMLRERAVRISQQDKEYSEWFMYLFSRAWALVMMYTLYKVITYWRLRTRPSDEHTTDYFAGPIISVGVMATISLISFIAWLGIFRS